MNLIPMTHHPTSEDYSPWDLLPAPVPMESTYLTRYFYENVAKHLIKDTVRIMSNGLHIDLERVIELEGVLNEQLEQVEYQLANNPLIAEFNKLQHANQTAAYIAERKTKLRDPDYYLKPFKPKDMVHRSYFMTYYAQEHGIPLPKEELVSGIVKWPVKLVRKLADSRPILTRMLNGELSQEHPLIVKAMNDLATTKASMYNLSFEEQIRNPNLPIPDFNPGSSKQKQELFEWLGIEPLAFSKDTGLPSWGRDQIEEVNQTTTNEDIRHFTQCFIDHSFAAIVRNNFIEAFYNYTVDNRLFGQYKLLGAKSGRFTSNSPNMLNAPSTGSIFAKPIKRCFTAPEGFVVASIDFSALEDRVVANLSHDDNKLGLFLEGLDGHSLSATYMLSKEVESLIGPYTDNKEASKLLKQLVDEGNQEAKTTRQNVKPISFKLAYGGYPDVEKGGFITEEIFDAYHNQLFPSITKFREEYVLPTAESNGQIHLGLGFNLQTDDPDRDIRTLNNACSQFWSILTALTINKIHQLIDADGLQDDILVTSTIYDSIYAEVRADPAIIKWFNDYIVPIMEQDFIKGQVVANSARLEIGPDWSTLTELSEGASEEEIIKVLESYSISIIK